MNPWMISLGLLAVGSLAGATVPSDTVTEIPTTVSPYVTDQPTTTATATEQPNPTSWNTTAEPTTTNPTQASADASALPTTLSPELPTTLSPELPTTLSPESPTTLSPESPTTLSPESPTTVLPELPTTSAPELPTTISPEWPTTIVPTTVTPTSTDSPTQYPTTALPTTLAPNLTTNAPSTPTPKINYTLWTLSSPVQLLPSGVLALSTLELNATHVWWDVAIKDVSPSSWFAVGFGGMQMQNTYAVVLKFPGSLSSPVIEEVFLTDYNYPNPLPYPQTSLFNLSVVGGISTYKLVRPTTATFYSFSSASFDGIAAHGPLSGSIPRQHSEYSVFSVTLTSPTPPATGTNVGTTTSSPTQLEPGNGTGVPSPTPTWKSRTSSASCTLRFVSIGALLWLAL